MTLAAFDPRLIEQYEDPRYLIHFQWRDNTKVYRFALVDIIKQEDIEPTCKQKQDEIGLLNKKYGRRNTNEEYIYILFTTVQ